jgi:hypothetical protein
MRLSYLDATHPALWRSYGFRCCRRRSCDVLTAQIAGVLHLQHSKRAVPGSIIVADINPG